MAKKIALGKGLASLIQETPNELLAKSLNDDSFDYNIDKKSKVPSQEAGEGISQISVTEIFRNNKQPRKIFNEKELNELSESIKNHGIIQPISVYKREEGGFEIIAGERRWRAAKMAGLDFVPAIIKRTTERQRVVMSIIENVQREDLNCVEEALAYWQLIEEFKLKQEEVAKQVGKERSTVANFLRILRLPREVISLIQEDKLSFGHAKILASIKEKEQSIRLANQVVVEQLSVRQLEQLAKKKPTLPKSPKENTRTEERLQKLDEYRQKLEKRTGFHFNLKSKTGDKGEISIKFTNEAEFNDVFEFLMTRK